MNEPGLPWYIRINKLDDDSIVSYECTCCTRAWRPHEIETHRADCKRKLGPSAP